jgi:hypothetical protein
MANEKADEHEETWNEFRDLVNMTPAAIEKFLDTDESKEVGFKTDGKDESVGHESGRKIIAIRHKKKADLTDADWKHMAKTVSYIKRHMAQGGPEKDKEHSPWRYSLMNWGHDPLKR